MKKILAVLLGMMFILFVSGIVYAAEGDVVTTSVTPNGLYGQCVSENANVKNACFASTKATLNSCKSTLEGAKNKAAYKQCKTNYKTAKKQCKTIFKAAKEQCRALKESSVQESE